MVDVLIKSFHINNIDFTIYKMGKRDKPPLQAGVFEMSKISD